MVLLGIAALMLDYNVNRATGINIIQRNHIRVTMKLTTHKAVRKITFALK